MSNSYPSTASGQANTQSNSWGPYTTEGDFSYAEPIGTGVPAESPAFPQSPSGSITNEAATWNFDNDLTSTENVLTNELMVESAQQGSPALANSSVQQTIQGLASTAVQINNFYGGAVGSTGNKFA